jgi:hypothetical protein
MKSRCRSCDLSRTKSGPDTAADDGMADQPHTGPPDPATLG